MIQYKSLRCDMDPFDVTPGITNTKFPYQAYFMGHVDGPIRIEKKGSMYFCVFEERNNAFAGSENIEALMAYVKDHTKTDLMGFYEAAKKLGATGEIYDTMWMTPHAAAEMTVKFSGRAKIVPRRG